MSPRVARLSLGGEVTRVLRRMLIEGRFSPGERLVEESLAKEMGASRTPLREALHRLEQEGLLARRPRGGYELKPLDPAEVEEAVETRGLLESYAASLAARRATDEALDELARNIAEFARAHQRRDAAALAALNAEFHALLAQAAGSRLLIRLLEVLEGLVERISRESATGMEAGCWSLDEHREILAALRARNPEAAARAAAGHVRRGGRHILDRLARQVPKP
jgi:DNA-binding GntR family transcriptional regulator